MTFIQELRGVARNLNQANINLNRALARLQAVKDDTEQNVQELYILTELVTVNRLIKTDYEEMKKGLEQFSALMQDMYSALLQQRMDTLVEMFDNASPEDIRLIINSEED